MDDIEIDIEKASNVVKKLAEKQKISIVLTEEQMQAINNQWKEQNPKMPTQVTFYVKNKKVGDLKIAGYHYFGDNCCISREK